jgi:hypothetical protein
MALVAAPVVLVSTVQAGWRTTVRGYGSTFEQAYENAARQVWPGYRIVAQRVTEEGGRVCVTLICERE